MSPARPAADVDPTAPESPPPRASKVAEAAKAAIRRRVAKVEDQATQRATAREAAEQQAAVDREAEKLNAVAAEAAAAKVAGRKKKKGAEQPGGPAPADSATTAAAAMSAAIDAVAAIAPVKAMVRSLLGPQPHLVCQRAWPGAVPPLAAAIQRSSGRAVLVVIPQASDLETLAADLAALADRPVLVFPQASDDDETETLLQNEVLQRLQVLSALHDATRAKAPPPLVLTTLPAVMHGVPAPAELFSDRRVITMGQTVDLDELRAWLMRAGYVSTTAVQLAGEFTVRGGILDVFPPDAPDPLRLEFFDDEVESIRSFDTLSQRSIERLQTVSLASTAPIARQSASLLDYLPADSLTVRYEPRQVAHAAESFLQRIPFPDRYHRPAEIDTRLLTGPVLDLMALAETDDPTPAVDCPLGDVQRIGGDLDKLSSRIDEALGDKGRGLVVCINEPELARLSDLFEEGKAFRERRLRLVVSRLSHGFEVPGGPAVLTVTQLLKRTTLPRSVRKTASRAIDSFLDLKPGDFVVHLSHGIAIYRGLKMIERQGQKHEHLELEFDEGTKVYVPTTKIDLVQRYIGGTKSQPKLAKIGSQTWVRQKQAAEAAVADMAADLLDLHAQRRSQPGIAFGPDSVWQSQFEGSFPYEETPDQITAVAASKADMMQGRPMDRLICGDVGFGKTEVAMRAAFKAVDAGYQVAVLVPTTVLAEQHYRSFRERMADFPFDIGRLSRFCPPAEEKEILRRVAAGNMDIVIGTHRLVSKDVHWFNLGLVIVDEEQRFGVAIKERLKQQRPNVDMMTLSATPIPRTLHMSLLGVRDISNLQTAPQERISIETKVTRFEDNLVRNAILRELNRGGQVYFVHNRVHDMPQVADRLQRLVPEARIVIGHGQMNEHQLERVMVDFIEHRYDILLATTIIESGLDIPNANTIFVDDADHYGLSELHQLRGRVGRYKHQAYCYLLIARHKHLNPDAARRMHAIEEYSQIGAGFGIAMRDLEIRGAGNLLGTQQSGHIAAVGYELYCQLLESAVRQLKHEPPRLVIDVDVNLPIDAYIPTDYVPEMRHKIDLYRRLSRVENDAVAEEMRLEMEDRFGRVPPPVERLLAVAKLKIDATLWSVRSIAVEGDHLVFTYGDRRRVEQLSRKHNGKLKLYGSQKAYWPIEEEGGGDLVTLAAEVLAE